MPETSAEDFETLDTRLNQVAANTRAAALALINERLANVPHEDTITLKITDAVTKAMGEMRLPADGKPGRDAMDTDILESVEKGRSYEAGTFALHNGGMILAIRNTDPIELGVNAAGWKVVADGIGNIEIEWLSERTSRIRITRTSGAQTVVEKAFPIPIYRGVFGTSAQYEKGDITTKDGGLWIATADLSGATQKPGEASSGWLLCVKSGDKYRSRPDDPKRSFLTPPSSARPR